MGLKEAFRKVGQAIEETKMKIGMKKYKKGGIQSFVAIFPSANGL